MQKRRVQAHDDSFPLSDNGQALIGLGAKRSASSSLALTAHSFQHASILLPPLSVRSSQM